MQPSPRRYRVSVNYRFTRADQDYTGNRGQPSDQAGPTQTKIRTSDVRLWVMHHRQDQRNGLEPTCEYIV